jgi:putative tricarboxylic transport membrane protein
MADVMSDTDAPGSAERGSDSPASSFTAPRIASLLLIGGGLFLLYNALQIGSVRGYSVVGPSIFPIVVSLGLTALGVALALRTSVWPDVDLGEKVASEEAATHWPTTGMLGALLVAYAFALGPLGYVVSTAILLPASARVLGSRALVRDVIVGVVLAIVIFIGFTRFLHIRLPTGILAPFL